MMSAAAAGLALSGESESAFAAKKQKTQAEVEYQDHPHGNEHCGNCEPFQSPNKCRTVAGTVSSQGWCKIYVEK
jgi:hypothetical protein